MIVVDAGHGGNDPGTSGNGIIEKDYNLRISQYIADRLKQLGVPVTLTRSTDETLTPEERVDRVLNAFGNNPEVVVISNHLNSGGGEFRCVSIITHNIIQFHYIFSVIFLKLCSAKNVE